MSAESSSLTSKDPDRWARQTGRGFDAREGGNAASAGGLEAPGSSSSEGFTFLQLADPQLGFIGMSTTKTWDGPGEEMELVAQTVDHINRLRPAFVIVCGDLTDSMDRDVRQRQVEDFKRGFDAISADIPLLCVCGNHDVGNTPSRASVEEFRRDFGDDYFAFSAGVEGCRVRGVVLNSNLYSDPSQALELHREQEAWLARELAAAKRDLRAGRIQHIVAFMHHPIFIHSVDESEDLGEEVYALPNGKEFRLNTAYYHLPPERRKALARTLVEHGCKIVFSGHWHRNGGAVDRSGLEQVITSAVGRQLGPDKSGFRIVTVTKQEIRHRYYALDDVPSALERDLRSSSSL